MYQKYLTPISGNRAFTEFKNSKIHRISALSLTPGTRFGAYAVPFIIFYRVNIGVLA